MKKAVCPIAILVLLFILGSSINQARAEGPKLLIPGTRFDFGYAPVSSMLSHYYLVKNVGTDTLKIEKVKPG